MFTEEDTWRVIQSLGLGAESKNEIQTRLDFIEQQSPLLVDHIKSLLTDIECADCQEKVASTEEAGLIKVDVLTYSEHRPCIIKRYRNELRHKLAVLMGYQTAASYSFPF